MFCLFAIVFRRLAKINSDEWRIICAMIGFYRARETGNERKMVVCSLKRAVLKIDLKGNLWYNIDIGGRRSCCVHDRHSPISAINIRAESTAWSETVDSAFFWKTLAERIGCQVPNRYVRKRLLGRTVCWPCCFADAVQTISVNYAGSTGKVKYDGLWFTTKKYSEMRNRWPSQVQPS